MINSFQHPFSIPFITFHLNILNNIPSPSPSPSPSLPLSFDSVGAAADEDRLAIPLITPPLNTLDNLTTSPLPLSLPLSLASEQQLMKIDWYFKRLQELSKVSTLPLYQPILSTHPLNP